jgi:DNA-binding Xre family transcriptional regulator
MTETAAQAQKLPRGITTQLSDDIIVSYMVTRISPRKPPRLSIAWWRERRDKMSQEKLAEEVGTTKSSISRWESGERDITLSALTAIAEVLKCSVIDLIDDPNHPGAILNRMDEAARKRAMRLIRAIKDDE